ncbi:CGP-CTERM sorting domain-containing protein [Thermococcus sp.]|uniref:CGP-CTERM sorting domain-containing protein n=1 Tax=Thermococcus sp. TaxID=35749 RepID=UPI0026154184|nr:CGP-CTERM sorting domain-containing protein [Thermococcus sp.]
MVGVRNLAVLLIALLLITPAVSAKGWAVKYAIKGATFTYPAQPLLSDRTLYLASVYEVNYTKGRFYFLALDSGSGELKFAERLIFKVNGTEVAARELTEGKHGILRFIPNGNLLAVFPAKRLRSSVFSAMVVAELKRDGGVVWAKYYQLSVRSNGKLLPRELMPVDVLVSRESIYILAQSISWQRPVTVLIKLSPNGTVIWTKSFTTADIGAKPIGIELSPDGRVLMLVSVLRPLLFWLDENGNITKGIAVSLNDEYILKGLLVRDGKAYVIGSIKPKLYEPFILALSADGKPLWAEKFPKTGYTFVSLLSDGNFYILGNAGSALQEGGSDYLRHVWVLSLGENGNPRWNIVTGDSMIDDRLGGIAVDDNVYVTYYRNFLMNPGLVFLAITKDGSTPCQANSPELKPKPFDVTTESAGPIKSGKAMVKALPLEVKLEKLDLSKKNPCSGSLTASSSKPKTSTTSTAYTHSRSSNSSSTTPNPETSTASTSSRETSPTSTASTTEKGGICGPAFLVVLSLLSLLHRRP